MEIILIILVIYVLWRKKNANGMKYLIKDGNIEIDEKDKEEER